MKPPKQEISVYAEKDRSVSLTTLNHSVHVSSSYRNDTLDKLSSRAADLLVFLKRMDTNDK